jgi:hypothetical protein
LSGLIRTQVPRAGGSAKFTLSSKDLPKDKTVVIESSSNLKKWEVAKRIPKNTSRFTFSYDAAAKGKYYRLRQK